MKGCGLLTVAGAAADVEEVTGAIDLCDFPACIFRPDPVLNDLSHWSHCMVEPCGGACEVQAFAAWWRAARILSLSFLAGPRVGGYGQLEQEEGEEGHLGVQIGCGRRRWWSIRPWLRE